MPHKYQKQLSEEEISMESMPSLKTYNIPKKNKNKEILTAVSLDSREAIRLKKEITDSLWESTGFNLEFLNIELVNNEKLEKRYTQKRSEMKEQTRSDVSDSFAYIRFDIIKSKNKQNDILENGLDVKTQLTYLPPSRSCCIGSDKYGIYLCRCADILSRHTTLDQIAVTRCTILVCKYMKGRLKAVQNQSNTLEPTPEFDGHSSQNFQHGKKLPQAKIYDYSQLYLYEINLDKLSDDLDSIYEENPRHCLPYAVVSFKAIRKQAVQSVLLSSVTPAVSVDANHPEQREQTSFNYADFCHHLKSTWQGSYYNSKRWLGELNIGLFSDKEKCPIEGPNILYVTQTITWEKLSAILPQKIFRRPPCFSRKPSDERKDFIYLHAEVHAVRNSPSPMFLEKLHKRWLRNKCAGVSSFISGMRLFLIPTGELTEKLGITVPGYPDVMHCLFVRHRTKDTLSSTNHAYEKFIKQHKQYMHVRLKQVEDIKRTNKCGDETGKSSLYSFNKEECDRIRKLLTDMFHATRKVNGRPLNEVSRQSTTNLSKSPCEPDNIVAEKSDAEVDQLSSVQCEHVKEEIRSEYKMVDEILVLSSDEDDNELVIVESTEELTNAFPSSTSKEQICSSQTDHLAKDVAYCCEDPSCNHSNKNNNEIKIDESTEEIETTNKELQETVDNVLTAADVTTEVSTVDENNDDTNVPVVLATDKDLSTAIAAPVTLSDFIDIARTSDNSFTQHQNETVRSILYEEMRKQEIGHPLCFQGNLSTNGLEVISSSINLFREENSRQFHPIDRLSRESSSDVRRSNKQQSSRRRDRSSRNNERSLHNNERLSGSHERSSDSRERSSGSRERSSGSRERSSHNHERSSHNHERSSSHSDYSTRPFKYAKSQQPRHRSRSRHRHDRNINRLENEIEKVQRKMDESSLEKTTDRNSSSASPTSDRVLEASPQVQMMSPSPIYQNCHQKVGKKTVTFPNGSTSIGCESTLNVCERRALLIEAEMRCMSSDGEHSGLDELIKRANLSCVESEKKNDSDIFFEISSGHKEDKDYRIKSVINDSEKYVKNNLDKSVIHEHDKSETSSQVQVISPPPIYQSCQQKVGKKTVTSLNGSTSFGYESTFKVCERHALQMRCMSSEGEESGCKVDINDRIKSVVNDREKSMKNGPENSVVNDNIKSVKNDNSKFGINESDKPLIKDFDKSVVNDCEKSLINIKFLVYDQNKSTANDRDKLVIDYRDEFVINDSIKPVVNERDKSVINDCKISMGNDSSVINDNSISALNVGNKHLLNDNIKSVANDSCVVNDHNKSVVNDTFATSSSCAETVLKPIINITTTNLSHTVNTEAVVAQLCNTHVSVMQSSSISSTHGFTDPYSVDGVTPINTVVPGKESDITQTVVSSPKPDTLQSWAGKIELPELDVFCSQLMNGLNCV